MYMLVSIKKVSIFSLFIPFLVVTYLLYPQNTFAYSQTKVWESSFYSPNFSNQNSVSSHSESTSISKLEFSIKNSVTAYTVSGGTRSAFPSQVNVGTVVEFVPSFDNSQILWLPQWYPYPLSVSSPNGHWVPDSTYTPLCSPSDDVIGTTGWWNSSILAQNNIHFFTPLLVQKPAVSFTNLSGLTDNGDGTLTVNSAGPISVTVHLSSTPGGYYFEVSQGGVCRSAESFSYTAPSQYYPSPVNKTGSALITSTGNKINFTVPAQDIVFNFTAVGPSFIDIGLRVKEQGIVAPTPIAIESVGTTPMSPLRIARQGVVYGVALVAVSDSNASQARVKLSDGSIKALRRFSSPVASFPDQSGDAIGHCSGGSTSFYATMDISNASAVDAVFTRTSSTGSGTSATSFTVPANSTLSKGGFGNLTYADPGCNVDVPAAGSTDGSATYSITQSGTVVDTATYYWHYTL